MEKPIRILQVLTIMNRGGAETMIMNYYRNIDRKKIQFDFLLHRKEKWAFDDEIKALGGKIYTMDNISLKKIPAYLKSLDVFLKNHKEYKIIHSHINAFSVFVLKVAKKNNIPIRIAHSHTSLYNLNLNPFSKKRNSLSFAAKFIAQNLFKLKIPTYSNYYFSCGEKAGKWLFGKKNVSKVKIINNAIDSDLFIYNEDKSLKMKKELSLEGKLVLGHVGNFVPEKNHSFLIKIFQEIKKINPKASLILVGAFGENEMEKLINENLPKDLNILGLRSDVPDILQAIDIFIFPSTNEGLPVTLIEAQAAGLKIIASDDITTELNITNLIDFLPLKKAPEYWAKAVLNSYPYQRRNTKNQIIEGDYDIKSNASALQEFYINKFHLSEKSA
jgi:glycosyltransferase involved in cell wall biosynthesis